MKCCFVCSVKRSVVAAVPHTEQNQKAQMKFMLPPQPKKNTNILHIATVLIKLVGFDL